MVKTNLVTHKLLRERYDYHPDGYLIHRKLRRKVQGNLNEHGYLMMGINIEGNNITFKVHRAIWMWHNDKRPEMIDHKDRNKTNNKIDNLRESTRSQNFANMVSHKYKKGKLLPKGVHHNGKKYCARITKNRISHYLGQFEDAKQAGLAYEKKAIELFGEYARPKNT